MGRRYLSRGFEKPEFAVTLVWGFENPEIVVTPARVLKNLCPRDI
jgi:hypothetical protein